jgi:hypothetical protein
VDLREASKRQLADKWPEILGLLFAGLWKWVTARHWTGFLPLPTELLAIGLFFSALTIAVAVVSCYVAIDFLRTKTVWIQRSFGLGVVFISAILGFLICPAAFWLVESLWKKAGTSAEAVDFLYKVVEPQIYGLSYGFVAVFVCFFFFTIEAAAQRP